MLFLCAAGVEEDAARSERLGIMKRRVVTVRMERERAMRRRMGRMVRLCPGWGREVGEQQWWRRV